MAATELLRRRQARRNLLDFTTYTKPDYLVNWHHRVLCSYLDRWIAGEVKRLMVFMPPRSGKSELVSRRAPAFILGKNPDLRIIACSYNASLAADMNRDVQRILDTPDYARLFPDTRLSGRGDGSRSGVPSKRTSEQFEVVGRQGAYYCAGVGGGITGRGFTHGIIDDPIKGRQEADSEASRRHVWDWYLGDFFTRRADDNASILITLTRWHPHDLAGLLLQQAEDDPSLPRWTVLRFPAVAEADDLDHHPDDPRRPGEALWPARFDEVALEETRKISGLREWAAVHQQRPQLREGGFFRRAWFGRFVGSLPVDAALVRYWDKGYSARGDFTAGVLMGRDREGTCYLVDVVMGRWSPNERNRIILGTAETDALTYRGRVRIRVEQPPGAGAETTATLLRLLSGFPVQARAPRGAKDERAEPLADQFEAGNVVLFRGPWNRDYIEQMCAFPNGANDDAVDATTGAFLELSRPSAGTPAAGGQRPAYQAPGAGQFDPRRGR